MKLVNIGFGGMVAEERILAVISPDSSPIKRIIQDVRERGQLIDASFGRKTQAVLVMDSGHVILSALTPDEITAKVSGNQT
ncbi:MAG: DUF370 domain-containing protein [Oscillospiraceae bacterium]|nr:DUF370 domain-containing protein [Oscillospiraceae bacterium]